MSTSPSATGYLNHSGAVVFARRLPMSRAQAWAAVTDPARTARWIGPWSGDPASGTVQLTMTAEEGHPVDGVEVVACEAPGLLVLRIGPDGDGWLLTVRVEGDDDEALISLEQDIADAESASDIGPGWEFYLDRLVEAEAGRDPGALSFQPDYHPGLSGYYRTLLGG